MVERRRRLLGKLGLSLAASLVGLLVVEVTLRFAWPEADAFYVFWPRLERVYHPEPGVMPGISGDSIFRINSRGVRGNEPDESDDVRIIARSSYQNSRGSHWLSERTGVMAEVLPHTVGAVEGADDLFAMFDVMIERLLAGAP